MRRIFPLTALRRRVLVNLWRSRAIRIAIGRALIRPERCAS